MPTLVAYSLLQFWNVVQIISNLSARWRLQNSQKAQGQKAKSCLELFARTSMHMCNS